MSKVIVVRFLLPKKQTDVVKWLLDFGIAGNRMEKNPSFTFVALYGKGSKMETVKRHTPRKKLSAISFPNPGCYALK